MASRKPIVLRIGEDIKYNHDFYNNVFTKRFDVVANEEPDRESFIKALKENKWVLQRGFKSRADTSPIIATYINCSERLLHLSSSERLLCHKIGIDFSEIASKKAWQHSGNYEGFATQRADPLHQMPDCQHSYLLLSRCAELRNSILC